MAFEGWQLGGSSLVMVPVTEATAANLLDWQASKSDINPPLDIPVEKLFMVDGITFIQTIDERFKKSQIINIGLNQTYIPIRTAIGVVGSIGMHNDKSCSIGDGSKISVNFLLCSI